VVLTTAIWLIGSILTSLLAAAISSTIEMHGNGCAVDVFKGGCDKVGDQTKWNAYNMFIKGGKSFDRFLNNKTFKTH
jgi:hypothetical protein